MYVLLNLHMKVQTIGDEFNENASLKIELSQTVKDGMKTVLRKRIQEKLGAIANFMDAVKWIE